MEKLAEELVLDFKLLGSNGVDFLVTETGPIVLEINPRFQGSLDTVEKAMNINLFEAHVRCFKGNSFKTQNKLLCCKRDTKATDLRSNISD